MGNRTWRGSLYSVRKSVILPLYYREIFRKTFCLWGVRFIFLSIDGVKFGSLYKWHYGKRMRTLSSYFFLCDSSSIEQAAIGHFQDGKFILILIILINWIGTALILSNNVLMWTLLPRRGPHLKLGWFLVCN